MVLKQLYNPLSNKFDLVRSSGTQTRVIPVIADMTTAQFRAEGTNLQWIVEAFSVKNGIYTPEVISYSKSINGNYTVIDFSWNTAFSGEIHVIYGVGKFIPQVNIPEEYFQDFQNQKLVYPKDGGTDFDIYAVMPENCDFMFTRAEKLQYIPKIDTTNTISMNAMFGRCVSLEVIEGIDMLQVTDSPTLMFRLCSSLKTCKIINLGVDIDFSDSPLLSLESIQFIVRNSHLSNYPTFTMTLHPDTLAKVQADTTVYEWNGKSYTGLITLATAMQITIQ